jgi:hypothetical protein
VRDARERETDADGGIDGTLRGSLSDSVSSTELRCSSRDVFERDMDATVTEYGEGEAMASLQFCAGTSLYGS